MCSSYEVEKVEYIIEDILWLDLCKKKKNPKIYTKTSKIASIQVLGLRNKCENS